jgi:hypothetical protein
MSAAGVSNGRVRAVIDAVRPAIDGGRFAVKRVTGEALEVEAHCFADGGAGAGRHRRDSDRHLRSAADIGGPRP